MAALNVDKVYRFVQFVANKESRGWVDPLEFNIAAELAQIAVYSRLETAFLSNKKIQSDMRPFLKKDSATQGAEEYQYPSDFRQMIGVRTDAGLEITELTQAELGEALNSLITAPATAYPSYVLRDDGIYIYPVTYSDDIDLEYIAGLSTAPLWSYTIVSSRPVYAATGGLLGDSVQFEFEDNLFLEISMLVVANVGMNLKMEAVAQYGMAFNK